MKIIKESPDGKFFKGVEEFEASDGNGMTKYNVIGKHRERVIKGEDGKNYRVAVPARIFYLDEEEEQITGLFKK